MVPWLSDPYQTQLVGVGSMAESVSESEGRVEFLSSHSELESDGETVDRMSRRKRRPGANSTEKV